MIKLEDEITVITTLDSDKEIIKQKLKENKLKFMYTSEKELFSSLEEPVIDEIMEKDIDLVESYIRKGYINVNQGLITLNLKKRMNQ